MLADAGMGFHLCFCPPLSIFRIFRGSNSDDYADSILSVRQPFSRLRRRRKAIWNFNPYRTERRTEKLLHRVELWLCSQQLPAALIRDAVPHRDRIGQPLMKAMTIHTSQTSLSKYPFLPPSTTPGRSVGFEPRGGQTLDFIISKHF